jgi:hypothetical protein
MTFYRDFVQNLKAWQAPAPQIRTQPTEPNGQSPSPLDLLRLMPHVEAHKGGRNRRARTRRPSRGRLCAVMGAIEIMPVRKGYAAIESVPA